MALIKTADDRRAQQTAVKMVLVGPAKIGKTTLAKTLDAGTTLVIDMEAGMLALDDWDGDCIGVREQALAMGLHPWRLLEALACLLSGPNPAISDKNLSYSQEHFEWCTQALGSRDEVFGKYDTIFFDSITDASRLCFSWCKTQPAAFSEKTGKPDNRGAYGLLGQAFVGGDGLFNQIKHCPDKNIIFVGLLDQIKDDYGRVSWSMQVEGGKSKLELEGIVDQIVSMVEMKLDDGTAYRAFVCQKLNEWGYPAGDRSGRLDVVEEPHLGKLLAKIKGKSRNVTIDYGIPDAQPDASDVPFDVEEKSEAGQQPGSPALAS